MWTSVVRRTLLPAAVLALLLSGSVFAQTYHRTDLTTDMSSVSPSAPNVDQNLVNAWGLSRGSGGPWWVSDNGTGLTTVYTGNGAPFVPPGATQPLVVKIPTPDGTGTAAPTGTVVNATSGFPVAPGKNAIFLFVTEDGTISGWNPGVNFASAVIVKNRAGKAVYKGCAIANGPGGPWFYATNFQTGRVEVWDGGFNRVSLDDDAFRYPGLDRNWSPFNIQNIGGNLVVTFAHRAPGSHDEDHGAGLGFVGVFTAGGRLVQRVQHGSWFNAPWGIAAAPGDFGKFTHRLLIGNFGDGTIHAFNIVTGRHEGAALDDTTGQTLTIPGLWAISFGGGTTNNGAGNALFFSAGPNDEGDGLLGTITAINGEQPGNSQ